VTFVTEVAYVRPGWGLGVGVGEDSGGVGLMG
jgi:hypothetical protein